MKSRRFILSVCLIILASLANVNCSAENSDVNKKFIEFTPTSIERFEQMFQTGEFDFSYRDVKRGANVLYYAARTGSLSRVKQLLERGADINVKDDFEKTVLFPAIKSRNKELVLWLIKQGLDVNA